MKVNDAYVQYKANPSPENYEQLGESLYSCMEALIIQRFKSRREFLKDAIGEAMCSVLSNLSNYDPLKNSFHMWVYAITYNTCIDMLRQSSQHKEWQPLGTDGFNPRPKYESKLVLQSLLKKLDESERLLVKLKIEGQSGRDIARHLGTSRGYIDVKWSRILEKLRTQGGGNEAD